LGNNPSFYRFLREAPWGGVWDSQRLDQAWLSRSELRDSAEDLFAFRQSSGARKTQNRTLFVRSEIEDDQLAYGFSLRYIREDWRMFLLSCLHRIGSLWQVLPHQLQAVESPSRRLLRWSIAVWYILVFSLAMVGGWRLRSRLLREPWIWGILLLATFTAVHAVYWSNMRMRAPCMPVVCLLAAAGLGRLIAKGGRS
jgi:hypothetical protein